MCVKQREQLLNFTQPCAAAKMKMRRSSSEQQVTSSEAQYEKREVGVLNALNYWWSS